MLKKFFPVIILFLVSVLFFYKTIFFLKVPFPGDLLISEYSPFKYESYLGYNPGSYPNKAQYFDTARQIYPWKTFSIASIKNGEFPLWNPHNFSGAPLFANFQSAVLYPLNLLYFIFAQPFAWSLQIMLQPFLALLFTYLYLREIKRTKIASIFGSVTFSFSLFFTVYLEYNTILHSVLYLPLILFFIEKIYQKTKFIYLLGLSFSVVFSLFAGHLQVFVLILFFSFIYSLFKFFSFKKRSYLIFFAIVFGFGMGIGIGSIQLLPTIELIGSAARSNQPYKFLVETLLLQFKEIILIISPDFYGNPVSRNFLLSKSYPGSAIYCGVAPLIFAILSILSFKKEIYVKFFLIVIAITTVFIFRNPISEVFYKFNIPLFSSSSPANAIFLTTFSLSVLSAFGIELFLKSERKKVLYSLLIVSLLLVLGWIYFALKFEMSLKNFLLSNAIFLSIASIVILSLFRGFRKYSAILIVLITLIDLFYFFNKFNPFVPAKSIYPRADIVSFLKEKQGINRHWGYGAANIEPNFATQLSIYSPDGYDPLYPKLYGEFIQLSGNGRFPESFNNQTRSDAKVIQGFGEMDFFENKYRQKILDLLGVKFIIDRFDNGTSDRTFPVSRFRRIYNEGGWRVFENLNAVPRVFLASDYKVAPTKNDFEKTLFSDEFDPSNTIILNKDLKQSLGKEEGFVKLISYGGQNIKISTSSKSNKLLFISDTYYPGWKVSIDGRKTEILRANYAFRAVFVPAGGHMVEFVFSPDSFKFGVKATIISLITLILGSVYFGKRKYES